MNSLPCKKKGGFTPVLKMLYKRVSLNDQHNCVLISAWVGPRSVMVPIKNVSKAINEMQGSYNYSYNATRATFTLPLPVTFT